MTTGSFFFNGVVTGSLLVHLLVFALFFALPSSPSGEMVTIYRVKVIEAPRRPKVRSLDVSTRPISALKLETPSLRPEFPPPEAQQSASPALSEILPRAAPEAPPPSKEPGDLATRPDPARQAMELPVPRAALPQLPAAPLSGKAAAESFSKAPPAPPTAPRIDSPLKKPPLLPPKIEELSRAKPTPEERLRRKLAAGAVRFEEPSPDTPENRQDSSRSAGSLLSLRIFQNKVQEAVQKNFTFPGGFEQGLRVRIRLTIERDGTVSSAKIVTSSGNSQFDYAATLAWRRAKLPPLPNEIEEERITRVISFSP